VSEGALTLTPEGLVLYANRRFAQMLRTPPEKVIGSEIHNWFAAENQQVLQILLQKENSHAELNLAAADGTQELVFLSMSRLVLHDIDAVCMVVTDLTEQKHTQAILDAEKLSNAILQQAADTIVICDKNGRIMRASNQAQAFYGKSPIGQLFEQAFPLRHLDGTAFSSIDSIDVEHSQSVEAMLNCNGRECNLLVSVGHLKGPQDELLGSVVTLTDITKRKRSEDKLLESKNLLRLIVENVPSRIFWKDSDLRYLGCNTRFALDAGLSSPGELTGKTDFEMPWKDQAELYRNDDKAVMESGTARRNIVEPQTTPDGDTIWLQTTKVPLCDKGKQTFGVLGLYNDITDRKQIEELLNQKQSELRVLIDLLPAMIWFKDTENRILRVNKHAAQAAGMSVEEIEGKPSIEIYPQDAARYYVDDLKVIRSGKSKQAIVESVRGPDNNELWVQTDKVPFCDKDGKVLGICVMVQDITERKQAEQALRSSEERFKTMFVQAPLGIALIDSLDGYIYEANPRFAEIAGRSMEEMANIDWLQITHPDDVQADLENMALMNAGKINGFQMEKRYLHPDGTAVWINMTIASLKLADQLHPRHLCMIEDITEYKAAEASVKYLNRVLSVLSGINSLIVRVNDREELFREACNIAVEAGGFRMAMIVIVDQSTMLPVSIISTGKDEELLLSVKNVMSSSEGMQTTLVAQAMREKKAVISNYTQNDPRLLFGKQYAAAGVNSMTVLPLIVSDEAAGAIALYANEAEFFQKDEIKLLTELASDIAYAIDHIEKHERLNYLAYYDELTGLANRSLFLERAAQYVHSAISGRHKLAIGLINLERFKNINDSLGRPAGDCLLKQVAAWLTQFAQDANLLARIDADHFAIVLPEIKTDGNLAILIENLMAAFQEHAFNLSDTTFRIGIKIGIAVFPDDGDNVDTLYMNAEAALKKTRLSGDRYLFYTQKMTEAVAEKLDLENRLRRAIDNEEFVLYYQPKVNLMSGEVTSAEALIRWNDPITGLVSPDKFIPILEETGMIIEVGCWALRRAVTDWLSWRNAGLPAVRIAVNVSPLQLHSLNFIDEIKEILSIDADAVAGLELEITESLIMQDIGLSTTRLEAVRALGMTVAIDDFGTGFSSLNYLSKLPVDTLKIDRSFVIEMDKPEGLALVTTIIVMAHALKLKVVAEGVETEQQMRQLLSLNCDEMQGFLFSKPVPATAVLLSFSPALTATANQVDALLSSA
jgi:diguanylate cyclase (GGDEF)-like protein/PAS domain S-box-containing protein